MKFIQYTGICLCLLLAACKKNIDLYPESNLNTGTYYSNFTEMKAALTGCYNGLQAPQNIEWQLTELRSDNSKMGNTGSSSAQNRDLSDLDMFALSSLHPNVYNYWVGTYANIRNINTLLQKLGVVYDQAAGTITINPIDVPITAADQKQLAGEALFLRAHHYFNLVRLFGGVFLVHKPISHAEAITMNRVSAPDIYKFIEADLSTAAASMNVLKYANMLPADRGRATSWAAKGLLAKVYLTQNKKVEAIPLLQDVKDNSGFALLTGANAYNRIFSVNEEANSEIIFAVRYKAGGLGLGSAFGNNFAPLNSGTNIINGDGDGQNYPTADLDTATNGDPRKSILVTTYVSGSNTQLYTRKYLSPVSIDGDGESDWPVLRFADILLMLAEAQGFTPASISLINDVRVRSGLTPYTAGNISSVAQFEKALADERRIEFAFENHRWFDLLRYNLTFTTITAEQTIKDHFADEYFVHYRLYPAPTPSLQELQADVTRERLLLPIPQKEIDTNTGLVIPQNPGY
ncbi:MAG TPA: RagB/SusD family nutrient uptake outer membrane protein [Flavisolibacter sp.]|nr:RagB/SusD family nutrient uptake outer membrane protein [Flavisolibacter sp.]